MKKSALLIGASGDIGMKIAKQLLNEGYFTYLHYNKNIESIRTLTDTHYDKQFIAVQADLSTEEGLEKLLKEISIPVDTIVYNAGISYYGLMTEISQEEIKRMIQLHITSLYTSVQHFLPNMIKNKYGNIVVISSIWGQVGASCEVLYSMTKGGQISFVKALAKEVSLSGVRVNAIAPGAIETSMLQQFTEEELQFLTDEIPIGRLGRPEEIADAVNFLLSDRSTYITGQVLSVNGGWY